MLNSSMTTVTEDPDKVDKAFTNERKERDLLPGQDNTIDMKDKKISDSNVWKFTMFVFCRDCSFTISQHIFLYGDSLCFCQKTSTSENTNSSNTKTKSNNECTIRILKISPCTVSRQWKCPNTFLHGQ